MLQNLKANAVGVVVYSVAAGLAAWGATQASEALASTPGGPQNNLIAAGLAWALPMVAIMAIVLAFTWVLGRTAADISFIPESAEPAADAVNNTAVKPESELNAQRDEFFGELFSSSRDGK